MWLDWTLTNEQGEQGKRSTGWEKRPEIPLTTWYDDIRKIAGQYGIIKVQETRY